MSGPRSNMAGVLVRRDLDVTESTLMFTTYKTNTHKRQKGKVLSIRILAIWEGGGLHVHRNQVQRFYWAMKVCKVKKRK